MSPRSSRNNLLDVLPGFLAEEELTAIHVRPTLSMPPFMPAEPANDVLPSDLLEEEVDDEDVPTVISHRISALLAEAEADEEEEKEEKEEGITTAVDVHVDESAVTDASSPRSTLPSPMPVSAPKEAPKQSSLSRFARVALAITASGFGVGFLSTSPSAAPPPPAPQSESARAMVKVPSVSIGSAAAQAAAPAPAEVASATSVAAPKKAAPGLSDANSALRTGDLSRAASVYQSVLARGGADHEALTGLGNVAAARHHTTDAMTFFERALARQPEYFPARLGMADALWDGGRTDAAKVKYLEIRGRYVSSMVPTRVLERTR